MLAEGRQMMTAKRTTIRRRLAIGRAPYRPPWRGRKRGHEAIVAPLAATLAATAALGLGVVIARAGRDRRAARALLARERQFALLPSEGLAVGLERIALGQLDLAIEMLATEDGQTLTESAVHEARKALKRLRALIRLLEDELGGQVFARENAVLREAGRRLSAARDAEVTVATLEDLMRRHPGELAHRRGVVRLHAALGAERDGVVQQSLGDGSTAADALDELRGVRRRAMAWSLSDRPGIETVEPALKRLYGRGRRRYQRAALGRGNRTRTLHVWRKRVKELRYAAEMLDRTDPDDGAARAGRTSNGFTPGGAGGRLVGRGRRRKRRRKQARRRREALYIRRVARRADELGELLGAEHDLAVLAARVRSQADTASMPVVGRGTRRVLLGLIAKRRRRLRKQALREGKRLYRRGPKRFAARVRSASAAASRG
jgi:CHAD domain-containing protein